MRDDGACRHIRAKSVHDGLVGKAVEAVAADARVAVSRGDRVGKRLGGHGLVERCVEARKLRCVAEELLGGLNELERGRNVQRCEVDRGLERGEHLGGEGLVSHQVRAAVHDAVAHGVDGTLRELRELIGDHVHRILLVAQAGGGLAERLALAVLELEGRFVLADAGG